jgi:N-acyl-D-aspartate/D-glutamate deacylase
VSTILFGNCGVGFAPVRREHHESLIGLMEAVEEIPGIALAEGLKWDWESFPDYLDALERIPHAIDFGAQIPHHPLRVYVMGDRAINLEPATADDIAEMHRLTLQAMQAGAFGFTTSRTNSHKTLSGDMVPSRYSEVDELMGISSALKGLGYGAFGMNSDFDDETKELAWMTWLAHETGRPVWFLLTDRMTDPQRWRRLMQGVHAARAQGDGHRAGRRASGQRADGRRHRAQSVLDPTQLPGVVATAGGGTSQAARRPGDARADPERGAVTRAGARAVAVPPADHHALGPHVRDGRSAGLRAGGKQQHRRHRQARQSHAGRGRL